MSLRTRTEMPRVCVVGPGFRFMSGLSVYTHRLSQALGQTYPTSTLTLRRLIPQLLYPGRARVGAALSGADYRGLDAFEGVDWYWGPSLVRGLAFLRRRRPDVLVLQWWTVATAHTYVVLALVVRGLGGRVLLEFHEVQDPAEAGLALARWYSRLALRLLARWAHGVVVHHEHDRELIQARVDLSGRPSVVLGHAPYDQFRDVEPRRPVELAGESLIPVSARVEPVSARVEPATGVGDRPVRLLFFGLIRPYKGLEDLVAAFDLLDAAEAAGYQLVIAGETWEGCTAGLEAARRSQHADRITVVNRYVSDAEAAYLFEWADALVLPYRRASSSGPLAIAMGTGTAVVHYAIPALCALTEHYSGAVPVPPGDVPALRDALGRVRALAGSAHEAAGSWAHTVRGYARLMELVGVPAPGSSVTEPSAVEPALTEPGAR